jgi:hypothetical protein
MRIMGRWLSLVAICLLGASNVQAHEPLAPVSLHQLAYQAHRDDPTCPSY